MNTATGFDLRDLPTLLAEVHAGAPVVLTRHGKPNFTIVPLESLSAGGPRPSIRALRGSGRGLWSDDAAAWVNRLRDKW